MKRWFVRAALPVLLLASLALAACGAPAPQQQAPAAAEPAGLPPLDPSQQVTITFASYNLASAGIGAEGTQQLMDEFMQQNPNITVEGLGLPSTDILAKVQAEVVAGNPPDVAQLVFSDLDFTVTNLGVKPLEALVPPAELEQHFAGMHPRGLELGRLGGQTYGLAYTFSTPVLFYNADLFRAAGLDPDSPPKTWEQVQAYGQQISQLEGTYGVYLAALGRFDWMYQSLLLSNGGRVLSEDRTTLTFAEPAAVDAVRMWQGLVLSGAHPRLAPAEATDAFAGGSMGMYLQTSALQANLIKAAEGKFELRSTVMPAFGAQPTRPTNSGSALFILSSDPVKQRAAWEFMKFVTSERGYTIITSKIGYLPLRPAIVDDPAYLKDWVAAHPLIAPNLEQLDRLEPWVALPGPNYTQISDIMMKAVETAIFAEGDPEPTLREAQERAAALMP